MDIGFRARTAHDVAIPGLELDLHFDEGEPLRIEVSSKFRRARIERELGVAGPPARCLVDGRPRGLCGR